MDPQYVEEQKEKIAQEMFGKSFAELEPHDRIRVGGKARPDSSSRIYCNGNVGGGVTGGSLAEPDRAPEAPAVKFGEDNPSSGSKEAAGGQA
eukprot:gene8812-8991_t